MKEGRIKHEKKRFTVQEEHASITSWLADAAETVGEH